MSAGADISAGVAAGVVPSAVRSLPVRVPSLLWCEVILAGVKLGLKTVGFTRTMQWIRRRTEGVPAREGVEPGAIAVVEYRLATAAALYPGRALCLEQSLALYYLLRRAGVRADLRLGIQPHPFMAHAWVEYRGEIVNDWPERVKQMQRVEELPL